MKLLYMLVVGFAIFTYTIINNEKKFKKDRIYFLGNKLYEFIFFNYKAY